MNTNIKNEECAKSKHHEQNEMRTSKEEYITKP
jgi:hypothetical protein